VEVDEGAHESGVDYAATLGEVPDFGLEVAFDRPLLRLTQRLPLDDLPS
jgi:hypothetical protein